jgi:hypothetical protein
MLSATEIVSLHDQLNERWHLLGPESADDAAAGDWLALVAAQHRANFELWHIEDEARTPGATDAELADVKRRVDLTNQRRNDLAEQLDRALLAWLEPQGLPNCEAPLHSESPGLIVDRLSILALKLYHTAEESHRASATDTHRQKNAERLALLEEQRNNLAVCLDALWKQVLAGQRRFKLYRQMKMYNDPELNPAVYSRTVEPANTGPQDDPPPRQG